MSTHLERLRWQHDDDTAGVYAEPSLEEQFEVEDNAFRHWDTLSFAQAAPLTGRWEWYRANRPAAASSSGSGGPTNRETRPSTAPPEGTGLAHPSIQRWMWTA